jgi:gamma-glutamyl-gamma-aminobutyrate hydrolase PuuD
MTGICRGIQFLNVMNGGTMMHHLEGHAGSVHMMDTASGEEIMVNSLHHQMCLPGPDAKVLGWASEPLSQLYIGSHDEIVDYHGPEIEALFYPKSGCAGVQYHPEMMRSNSEGALWYVKMVDDLLTLSTKKFESIYVAKNRRESDGFCVARL